MIQHCDMLIFNLYQSLMTIGFMGHRGRDRVVVGFTTTCAISAYHHLGCEFEVYLIQHYVIKCVSDLQLVGGFLWLLWFPPPIKLTAMI